MGSSRFKMLLDQDFSQLDSKSQPLYCNISAFADEQFCVFHVVGWISATVSGCNSFVRKSLAKSSDQQMPDLSYLQLKSPMNG